MVMSDEELGREMAAVLKGPNARGITDRCACGSGQYPFNLFAHTGKLLLLQCCYACEKQRRNSGEELT